MTSRPRVLLTEASSLTAREFVTVYGPHGVDVEVVTSASTPLLRFSRWVQRRHRLPAPSDDPIGYLQGVDALMEAGTFDALIATHEQTWLLAAGRHQLCHFDPIVPSIEAIDQVMSKVAFARTADDIGLPQPTWLIVDDSTDEATIAALMAEGPGRPVWIKAGYSTAGRGVYPAHDAADAFRLAQRTRSEAGETMIQLGAPGQYAQVQAIAEHGRVIAVAMSEQLALGAGGSAAARRSVDHPKAAHAIEMLCAHLGWHGGITLDYFHVDGEPQFIECNPRTVEPGNAAAAGVNLPMIHLALGQGETYSGREPIQTTPGVITRSGLAMVFGAAERTPQRRRIIQTAAQALRPRGELRGSTEVLTPLRQDPPSAIMAGVALGLVLARPTRLADIADDTVGRYRVTPTAVDLVRATSAA